MPRTLISCGQHEPFGLELCKLVDLGSRVGIEKIENIGAQFSIGALFFILNLPLLLGAFLLQGVSGRWVMPLIVIGVIYAVTTAVLSQAAKSVLTVVLYRFATKGEAVQGFDGNALRGAFGRG